MNVKNPALWMAWLALTADPAFAQTAPGAPGSDKVIPEKESPPLTQTQPDSDVKSGRSLSQKLDASGGVIKPSTDVDPGITKPAPDPHPNSTPVIKPPGTPGGPPGPEAK
ncbi:hypothetical protein [Methyloferula stellata]|uniref:hypothetical protein n=1 Tax=Methyloferula stellata TaxID=876270 RepID=UPI0003A882B1|nr:hypothetical protein [Methyloferula stellata]